MRQKSLLWQADVKNPAGEGLFGQVELSPVYFAIVSSHIEGEIIVGDMSTEVLLAGIHLKGNSPLIGYR